MENCTADGVAALAPQREQRRHQNQRHSREGNNIVQNDNQNYCMDETDGENGGLKKSAQSESSSRSIIHQEFVYQLSWFFYLLAYSIDVLQISKDKATAIMKARHQQGVAEMKVMKKKKKKKKKKTTNNSNGNAKETRASSKTRMSAFQRATIKDFKAKSRAGKLSMDDWELLVMAMKDANNHNVKYSVASSSDVIATRNENVGGNEAGRADKEDITSSEPTCNANNNDCTTSSSNVSSSCCIDPTNFYQYLSSYDDNFSPLDNNKHNTRRKNASLAINTNNVGDAAMVFRCLVGALETSVKDELSRMRDYLDKLKEGQEKDELDEGEKRYDSNDRGPSAKQLLLLLEQIQLAMRHSWSGTLVSRIVGMHSTTTTISSPNMDESVPNKPPTPTTTAMPTTTTLQRMKKNGNLERMLPVPFPLPVINRQDKSNGIVLGPTNYFHNLEQAFHSVTIDPIPIRGYDWSELIQRGEVIEEQYVTKLDGDEISVVERDSTECHDDTKAESTFTEGTGENGIEASRSIACQTESFGYDIGTQTLAGENSLMEVPSSNQLQEDRNMEESGGKEQYSDTTILPEAKFVVEKSSCYAAAVAALVMSNQTTSVASRHSRVRRPSLNRNNSEESRGGHRQSEAAAGSDDNNALDMEYSTLSGMEIDALAEDDVQQDDTVLSRVFSPTESLEDEGQSPLECSSSEEESSVESHVTSVDTDTSSEENAKSEERDDESFSTRSSAIETPSDIDNLSLGSFTDSELEFDEKEDKDNADIHVTAPAVKSGRDKATDREERLETKDDDERCHQEGSEVETDIYESTLLVNNSGEGVSTAKREKENKVETQVGPSAIVTATIIDFDTDNDTGAIRCSVNESTSSSTTTTSSASSTSSYSSTNDSSATDSARSSSDESTFSTSDDDEDDIDNSQLDKKAAGWITRKETRLRLPLPQSLIFHLKRFEYSVTTGRVEKLTGAVDIPHKLNVRVCCLDGTPRTATNNPAKNDPSTAMRDNMHSCCFEYYLSGAIVHVDPKEMEDEIEFGGVSEGHYVTLLHSPSSRATNTTGNDPNHYERDDEVGTWTEIDDEMIRTVRSESEMTTHRRQPALDSICGCDKYYNGTDSASSKDNRKEECRYAMLLVYSRTCQCLIE